MAQTINTDFRANTPATTQASTAQAGESPSIQTSNEPAMNGAGNLAENAAAAKTQSVGNAGQGNTTYLDPAKFNMPAFEVLSPLDAGTSEVKVEVRQLGEAPEAQVVYQAEGLKIYAVAKEYTPLACDRNPRAVVAHYYRPTYRVEIDEGVQASINRNGNTYNLGAGTHEWDYGTIDLVATANGDLVGNTNLTAKQSTVAPIEWQAIGKTNKEPWVEVVNASGETLSQPSSTLYANGFYKIPRSKSADIILEHKDGVWTQLKYGKDGKLADATLEGFASNNEFHYRFDGQAEMYNRYASGNNNHLWNKFEIKPEHQVDASELELNAAQLFDELSEEQKVAALKNMHPGMFR